MATWNDLTNEQKNTLVSFVDTLLRPTELALQRVLNQRAALIPISDNGVYALLNLLDANTPIPNTSGLAGAQTLTNNDVMAVIQTIDPVDAGALALALKVGGFGASGF